jgi:ABC-type dipeptide/oligopeptide/nickel transport system permease component
MFKYIIKRVLMLVPIVFVASSCVFILSHAALPGDPVDFILGENALPGDVEYLRQQLHLNEPLHQQYFSFLKGVATFDWGESIFKKQPVI